MGTSVSVNDIMTKNVVTLEVDAALDKATDLFKKHKIRHIPVIDNGRIVGILSQTDILRLSFGNIYAEDGMSSDDGIMDMLSINQVMKSKPDTVKVDETVEDVAKRFLKAEYHALPVVDGDKLVGIVTTTDVIRHFVE